MPGRPVEREELDRKLRVSNAVRFSFFVALATMGCMQWTMWNELATVRKEVSGNTRSPMCWVPD